MGRLYLIQLDGRVYSCRYCRSHLAQCDELVSKVMSFHCRHGKAYLFNTVVNVSLGPQEDRLMTTGKHTVADICCNCCQQVVGWKYESAFEKSQKYKEGKFILERAKMIDGDGASFYLDAHEVDSDADNE
ncbi:protein yippee-like At5g53940 isoform X1 [Physcomitrium patens]|uniref:protein yippee-like At5g53940 isoform X1 n=1 Tax=Physcomitrium patens TaxID=3218 RepID=UPI00024ABFFF|nr:protein yippee-like At5g53940 isoform X2 [Physcomitrium patens]|eukprot:XP_024385511.1 protein yippee-like At5g53940 isoform X2 [Physcomitrella patens]